MSDARTPANGGLNGERLFYLWTHACLNYGSAYLWEQLTDAQRDKWDALARDIVEEIR